MKKCTLEHCRREGEDRPDQGGKNHLMLLEQGRSRNLPASRFLDLIPPPFLPVSLPFNVS